MRAFSFPILIACGLVVAVLCLAGCQPVGEPEPAEDTAAEEAPAQDDEAAIRSLADRYVSGWANGDAVAIASLYASDGDLVGVEGRVHKGRSEVEGRLAEDFEAIFNGTQISITTDSVRFLEPGVAITDGSFEVTGITGPDGAAADPLKGLYSNVVVKEGGEWALKSVRPMVPQTAPSESDE